MLQASDSHRRRPALVHISAIGTRGYGTEVIAQTGISPAIHTSPLPPLPAAGLPVPQPWLESACRILVWRQGR